MPVTTSWVQIVLACLNVFQAVALAWIAARFKNGTYHTQKTRRGRTSHRR